MLWHLCHLPLYYKRPIYYCLGSVVKSPVLYFSSHLNPKCFTLLFVWRLAESRLRSFSSQRHRLASHSRSKSRTHRLNGDIITIPVLSCIVSRVDAIANLLYVFDWSLDVDGLPHTHCLISYLYKASVLPIVMASWVSCLNIIAFISHSLLWYFPSQ